MTTDPKKQYQWRKTHAVTISFSLIKNTDGDIIDYLDRKKKEGFPRNAVLKEAVREKMARE